MLKKEDILHIAHLAKLSLNDNECNSYQKDLNEIIEFASKISDLTEADVQEHFCESEALREDLVNREFERKDMLSNASQSENGFISVSKVIADA